MREVMKEKGVADHHHYDPASKYFNNFATASEPLANYMDVSF